MVKSDGFYKSNRKSELIDPFYNDQELTEYSNNPLIEALPPIFSDDDVYAKFMVYPIVEDTAREKSANIRYHMIKRLKDFTQPLNVHITIERSISNMLRRGYINRNPLDTRKYYDKLNEINEQDKNEILKPDSASHDVRSSAISLSIIGISGIGKTTAVEKLLEMYPQVIQHSSYKNNELIHTQIVWLKLDCPYDGSLKTFCQSFFKAVDDVLGTTRYFEKYGNARNSKGKMMIDMERISAIYSIGIIAVDEMQHLIPRNNPDEILNFLVTLENKIGVPMILIGTFKALSVLEKDLRQARRATSEQSVIWDRMEQDDEWDLFIQTLWDFQWLKTFAPLTQELNDIMYDQSQGITAIAVNLFILAQERALENGETITIKILKQTAKEDLYMVQKMITALRNQDLQELSKYEDISICLEDILGNIKRNIDLHGRVSQKTQSLRREMEKHRNNNKENIIVELNVLGIFDNLSDKDFENIAVDVIKNNLESDFTSLKRIAVTKAIEINDLKRQEKELKSKKPKAQNLQSEDLRSIYKQYQKEKRHIYEILKEAGYIKDPLNEIWKVS